VRPCRALHPPARRPRPHGLRRHDDARHAGFFRFAHIDGLIPADPAVHSRPPKIHRDESRTQGPDRLDRIRFLQVAQTVTVHHSALPYVLGINALRASEPPPAESRTTPTPCAPTGSCTWSARATNPPPCHSPSRSCGSSRPARDSTTGPLVLQPISGRPDRPARRLPDGRLDREDRRHPAAHQPLLVRHAAMTNASTPVSPP
jgi:integrase/recombinase XerD